MSRAALPFEVVRRAGVYHARATGLAKIFPDRFERTETGDWLIPAKEQQRYNWGSNRQQEAAIAFERFIRTRLKCWTRLQRTSDMREARVDWILHITHL